MGMGEVCISILFLLILTGYCTNGFGGGPAATVPSL
jgi:hypothetical protein